ncbi:DUF418 domain-containing protein [Chitinimonas taiwanensis]|uniref:DUF418 domain-containing protein n=1 Tax=Chitinimonas taiwanensis DSM 18899 TaxID=1121279 RepID=A0A1K2HGV1_9NEIS|nr:DUF418 domain-containing protein [Chitinimonas taiwanensis]SFZ75729.1 uncharacterized protein SAMN02745887_01708 [Chitinimonas taiwanensis DSM 18899]
MSTPEHVRIAQIDALRGAALLGILLINFAAMASGYFGTGLLDPRHAGLWDQMVQQLLTVLVETKFYLLFSCLFGYSFTLQMDSAERAGAAFSARMLRRLAGLALLGLAHALLLFPGDILLCYALLGLVLLYLRRLSDRALRRWAIGLWLGHALLWLLPAGLLALLAPDAPSEAGVDIFRRAWASELAYRGSWATTLAEHWRVWHQEMSWVLPLVQMPSALAMFITGLLLGRARWLSEPTAQRELLVRLACLGLVLGLPGALLYAQAGPGLPLWRQLAQEGIGILSAPWLSAAYAALFLLALQGACGVRMQAWLAPAGRMALSHYLLQSLCGSLLFSAYGLRLYGQLGSTAVLGLALLLFGAQLWLSRYWLASHRYGPVEWGLRALTLWRWPAWRRADEQPAASPLAPR